MLVLPVSLGVEPCEVRDMYSEGILQHEKSAVDFFRDGQYISNTSIQGCCNEEKNNKVDMLFVQMISI